MPQRGRSLLKAGNVVTEGLKKKKKKGKEAALLISFPTQEHGVVTYTITWSSPAKTELRGTLSDRVARFMALQNGA